MHWCSRGDVIDCTKKFLDSSLKEAAKKALLLK